MEAEGGTNILGAPVSLEKSGDTGLMATHPQDDWQQPVPDFNAPECSAEFYAAVHPPLELGKPAGTGSGRIRPGDRGYPLPPLPFGMPVGQEPDGSARAPGFEPSAGVGAFSMSQKELSEWQKRTAAEWSRTRESGKRMRAALEAAEGKTPGIIAALRKLKR